MAAGPIREYRGTGCERVCACACGWSDPFTLPVRMAKRQFQGDLDNLKDLMEANAL